MGTKDLRGKRVLVTGASGFIGSHMAKRLMREQAQVAVMVRGSDLWRLEDASAEIRGYRADIRNREQVRRCIQQVKPDLVFNMAAYGVDARQRDYSTAAETNIMGTVNLMEALAKTGCEKVLNIGSCMEYGNKEEIIREDASLKPFNIYGSTKAAAGLLAHQLARENGIGIVTLRAFGVFGENEGSHKFFPHLILSALRGSEVKLTACEQYRDYCYIANIMDAFVLAAGDRELKDEVFNIGSGEIHPLKYFVDMVYEYIPGAQRPNYGAVPYRADEMWRPQPEISKIRTKLGWQPQMGLRAGLERTIAWYRQNQAMYWKGSV